MNRRQRKIVTYILVTYAILFFLLFVVFPLMAVAYPSTGKYFGYFPFIFFFPFFWGFGGRNQSQGNQSPNTQSGEYMNHYHNETTTGYDNGVIMGQTGQGETSPWRYMKYVTVALAMALAVALYFALR